MGDNVILLLASIVQAIQAIADNLCDGNVINIGEYYFRARAAQGAHDGAGIEVWRGEPDGAGSTHLSTIKFTDHALYKYRVDLFERTRWNEIDAIALTVKSETAAPAAAPLENHNRLTPVEDNNAGTHRLYFNFNGDNYYVDMQLDTS